MRALARAVLVGTSLLLGLSPLLARAAAQASAQVPAQTILEGHHERLVFERAVTRVAVGNPDVIDGDVVMLSDREVLLLAKRTGRTTLMVWFDDGSVETRALAVRRDFSALESALARIHAGIRLEVAPDRDVLILSGVVPDLTTKLAAVDAAERYVAARDDAGADVPLLSARGEVQVPSAPRTPRGSVLDLLLVETLPATIEARLRGVLQTLGSASVEVHRFQRGAVAADDSDLIVLTGTVETQTDLTRLLQVCAHLVAGIEAGPDDIIVLSDESGALVDGQGAEVGSGSSAQGFGSDLGGGSGGSSLFGSSNAIASLGNRLGANLARAKALSVADGRVLSFIEVRDLPQVRVDIRVYEVSRTDLLNYAPEITALASDTVDFDANVLSVLSFLADGFGQQLELTGGRFAVDAAFRLLESRGIARNLSGPTITVLSGERAQFLVGGEVPIPQNFAPAFGTPDAGTGVTPGVFSSVVFRPFGVQLGVRPLVGEHDQVTLDLVTQVARPDAALTTLLRETTGTDTLSTAFETRAMRTSTRLADGNVLLLGGLIQRRSNDNASYTPWLESIPLLGWLFKRFSVQDEDLEVFVIVNPSVIRDPVDGVGLWLFPEIDAMGPRGISRSHGTRAAPPAFAR